MTAQNNIKVMIVDDSLSMRLFLKKILHAAEGIEVVASAADPIEAMEKLKSTKVDVMTLDVEMPKMDGLTFLKKIMRLKPMPVVMISTLTKKGSQTAVEALSHGAIDVVGKPSHDASLMQECTRDIIQKITEASRARVGQKAPVAPAPLPEAFISQEKTFKIDEVMPSVSSNYLGKPIIAIASSTGGPQVLKEILAGVDSPNTPPIVIVQHIGVGFSEALARSIDKVSPLNVIHAQNGQLLKRGNVYFAPAGMHTGVVSEKEYYKIKLYDLERVNRHKPSADVLFRTLNTVAGKKALSFVLTGMGDDGAIGLKELHMSGAQTYVQSEESCVVYGMPRNALALESQHGALTVSQIIKKIKEYVS